MLRFLNPAVIEEMFLYHSEEVMDRLMDERIYEYRHTFKGYLQYNWKGAGTSTEAGNEVHLCSIRVRF